MPPRTGWLRGDAGPGEDGEKASAPQASRARLSRSAPSEARTTASPSPRRATRWRWRAATSPTASATPAPSPGGGSRPVGPDRHGGHIDDARKDGRRRCQGTRCGRCGPWQWRIASHVRWRMAARCGLVAHAAPGTVDGPYRRPRTFAFGLWLPRAAGSRRPASSWRPLGACLDRCGHRGRGGALRRCHRGLGSHRLERRDDAGVRSGAPSAARDWRRPVRAFPRARHRCRGLRARPRGRARRAARDRGPAAVRSFRVRRDGRRTGATAAVRASAAGLHTRRLRGDARPVSWRPWGRTRTGGYIALLGVLAVPELLVPGLRLFCRRVGASSHPSRPAGGGARGDRLALGRGRAPARALAALAPVVAASLAVVFARVRVEAEGK